MSNKIYRILQRLKKTLINSGIINRVKGLEMQVQDSLRRYEWREAKRSFGELYPDKTFYVIRSRPSTSSIGPLVMRVCKQLQMCESKGYIPVVDFSFYENVYLEENEVGKINPWEYYFEQPTMYSMRAVCHAQNVIWGDADCHVSNAEFDILIDNESKLKEYCAVCEKYVHMSSRIEKKAKALMEQGFHPDWRILGCTYRGTDYRNRRVVGEHKQPTLSEEIKKARELLGKWKCDHIFLATEDKGALERFKEEFKEKLVYVEKERYPSDVSVTQEYKFNREQDAYYKGEEYLLEIYILSHCNCLLSARVGILSAALPMNNMRYEHKYIYDLGLYTEEDYL